MIEVVSGGIVRPLLALLQNWKNEVVERLKRFLEVTDYDSNLKYLVPIDKITGIVRDGSGKVFIEMCTANDGESSGVLIKESFDDIKKILNYEV